MSLSYFDSYGYMKKLVVIRSIKIMENEFEVKFGLSGNDGIFTLRNKNKIKYFEFDAIGNLLPTSTLYEHIENTILSSLEPLQNAIDGFDTRIDALEGVLDPRVYVTGTLSVNGQIVSIPITSGKSCKITGTILFNDTGYANIEVLCKCISGTTSITLWNLDYANAGTKTITFNTSGNELRINLTTNSLTKYKLGYDLNYLTL